MSNSVIKTHSSAPVWNLLRLTACLVVLVSVADASAQTTVRVGTAGDYRPLTWYDPATGAFSGRDIDLIQAFANNQGLTLDFVQTTWPTLMNDLLADDFDMAVGGISWTEQRASQALTSVTIETTGKVALVQCGTEAQYGSLADIDREGVTVVENRGGTNEQFAHANLRHATLIIVPDNTQPFEYLSDGRADVFFTDSIEAVYVQNQGTGLCAVNPDHPYTHIDKVFLFAESQSDLRDAFDRWFSQRSE